MIRFPFLTAFLLCTAYLGFGMALAHAQEPGDELKPELEAVRKELAELEPKIILLKQRELALQKAIEVRKNGYFTRLQVKGRLSREVIPKGGLFGIDLVIWSVTAGENRYELYFGNSPSKDTFMQLAQKRVGMSVVVSGELGSPRHPHPQRLEVNSFTVPEK